MWFCTLHLSTAPEQAPLVRVIHKHEQTSALKPDPQPPRLRFNA
jgi:hypothetical protein